MKRRLLPYEHELIRALGISEDDYLDFLSVQHDYTRSPEEKLQELRGEPVSIVLAVVGILFQVASILFAPKPPKLPELKNQASGRQQRFAPRFGFNNVQELARYGDPVNLIYCDNDPAVNPNGGVRVGTSLIWSSVSSQGSSQFMQTLMLVGAGQISEIDFTRSAFGQTPIRQFISQKTWTYFNANGNVRFSNIVFPAGDTGDPTRTSSADLVYRINRGGTIAEGFSQAFSPSSLITCGVYSPIPINVQTSIRTSDGDTESTNLGIQFPDGEAFRTTYWGTTRPAIPVGTRFTLRFDRVTTSSKSEKALEADEERINYFSRIDAASTYKLGSAKFKLAASIASNDLEATGVNVTFECIESGICPDVDYTTKNFLAIIREWRDERLALRARNAEIDTILLNPPPIYDPIVFGSLNSDLDGIQVTIDQLEEYVEAIRNGGKLDGISAEQRRSYLITLSTEALSDPVVAAIAQDIIDREDTLVDNDALTKSQRRAIKREIKKLERELTRAIEQYGFREGIVVSPRTGLPVKGRDEIRIIQRLISTENRRAFQRLIDKLGATGGGRNLAAEAQRNVDLAAEKTNNLARIQELNSLIDQGPDLAEDLFYTKCLIKTEEASYQTITDCRVVRFSLKTRVYQRISGRQEQYGEAEVDEFKLSDNGLKARTSMFWMFYRESSTSAFKRVNRVFAIRRRADQDNFLDLTFIAPANGTKWEFKFEPIAETTAEFKKIGLLTGYQFAYIENNGELRTIVNADGTNVTFLGKFRNAKGFLPPIDRTPYGVSEWGLFSTRSDTQISYSFDNGPEITILAVTEQREEPLSNYPRLYENLAMFGFNAYSGQGIQDLRSVTVYVNKGKRVSRLRDDGTYPAVPDGPSSYAPDIFLDTVLDTVNGIGRFARVEGIDLKALALAKQFCRVNDLFMDGVIADQTPWREFWTEVALFSLLEFGRIGGKETLVPAIPCTPTGQITRNVSISALFNQGNIIEESYKEEFIDYGDSTQDLIATMIYRATELNETFPRNSSVEVRRSGVLDEKAVRQTFDLSQFVTNRSQAVMFGKLICNQRRYIRRAIEFSTFPTDSVLSPGAYIYVAVGRNEWDRVSTGMVEAGGVLNTPLSDAISGSGYTALLYKPGSPVARVTSVSVSGGVSGQLASYAGYMFVLGQTVTNKRVFRVTEVQMDEDGQTNVKAVEHPCVESGSATLSQIADLSDNLFTVR